MRSAWASTRPLVGVGPERLRIAQFDVGHPNLEEEVWSGARSLFLPPDGVVKRAVKRGAS